MATKTTQKKDSTPKKPKEIVPTSEPKYTTISIFGSEKGGMGKTIVASVAVEQMTAANHQFYLIDADASTPNVGLTYRPEIYQQYCDQIVVKIEGTPYLRLQPASGLIS